MKFDFMSLKKLMNISDYEHLLSLLSNCPTNILNQMELCTFKKNDILMTAGEITRNVYILISGSVEALEEKVPNLPYIFAKLRALEFLGDFELFADTMTRYVTLTAASPCICIMIDANTYLSWIKEDNHALFLRMKILLKQIAVQTQLERQFLFLDSETKLVFYLLSEYESKGSSYPFILNENREYIAAHMGCSTRNLNRTVTTLEKNKLISRKHGKIFLEKAHIIKLYKFMDESQNNMKFTEPTF